MKINAKFVAICLAVVFVLVLMCGVLVACNENPETPLNPDQNETPDLGGDDEDESEPAALLNFISEDELEHIVGYAATEGAKDGQHVYVSLEVIEVDHVVWELYDESYGTFSMHITVELETGDENDYHYVNIIICEGEAEATTFFENYMGGEGGKIEGNRIYLTNEGNDETDEEEFYKNTVLNATVPATFSSARMNFLKECAGLGGIGNYLEFDYATNYRYDVDGEAESYELVDCELQYAGTNRITMMTYSVESDVLTSDQITAALGHYAEGSYIDFTRESGYVFEKLIPKLGLAWSVSNDEAYVHSYYFDATTPKEIVVPATIDNMPVVCVGIHNTNLTSIALSEGIKELTSCGDNEDLISVSLPKSLTTIPGYFPFSDSHKLTTIKYAGSIDDWNALVQANNIDINERWCKYMDEGEEKILGFTVQCSNGSISYPTAA